MGAATVTSPSVTMSAIAVPPAANPSRWEPQPEAARLVGRLVADFLGRNAWAAAFADRLRREAGVRFVDLVDHVHVPPAAASAADVRAAGFEPVPGDRHAHAHPGGIIPTLVLGPPAGHAVAVRVESVADLLAAHDLCADHTGRPGDRVRTAPVLAGPACAAGRPGAPGLAVVERHGDRHVHGAKPADDHAARMAQVHAERFRLRRRRLLDPAAGFAHAEHLIADAVAELDADHACCLFFAAERAYWERRNRAARAQKARQDALGIGWANHDRHAYRSSRRHFARLIAALERMGFRRRERLHAGREAGWGTQVLEQRTAGVVVFADVDLSPDELTADFAHDPLPERDVLGPVGLWCALHGESFLEAGLHHLGCALDPAALTGRPVPDRDAPAVKPPVDALHLRQAFTAGERWPVQPERIDALLAAGRITAEQADTFRAEGAIGSHLAGLERDDGFKGFGQAWVGGAVAATGPREPQRS